MNTLKLILFNVFALILFANGSCSKPEPIIPTGNHTFSCRINGKLFLPKSSSPIGTVGSTGDGLSFLRLNNNLDIAPLAYNSPTAINFYIKNYAIGIFILTDSNGRIEYPYDNPDNQATLLYNGVKYLSKQGSGHVTFTDVTTENVKGTFEFTLYNENDNNDVIHVTEGKFDD